MKARRMWNERYADACIMEQDRYAAVSIMMRGGIRNGVKPASTPKPTYLNTLPAVQHHNLVLQKTALRSHYSSMLETSANSNSLMDRSKSRHVTNRAFFGWDWKKVDKTEQPPSNLQQLAELIESWTVIPTLAIQNWSTVCIATLTIYTNEMVVNQDIDLHFIKEFCSLYNNFTYYSIKFADLSECRIADKTEVGFFGGGIIIRLLQNKMATIGAWPTFFRTGGQASLRGQLTSLKSQALSWSLKK